MPAPKQPLARLPDVQMLRMIHAIVQDTDNQNSQRIFLEKESLVICPAGRSAMVKTSTDLSGKRRNYLGMTWINDASIVTMSAYSGEFSE